MTKMTRALLPAAALLCLVACKKDVDPAYISEIDSAADAVCACSHRPNVEHATTCANNKEKGLHPEAPGGGASAEYESKLNDKSVALVRAAREKAQRCIEEIGKRPPGEGPGQGGPGRRERGGNGGNGGGMNGGGGAAPAPSASN